MRDRGQLLLAIFMTVCGVSSMVLAALGGPSVIAEYIWPANAVVWTWNWYAMTRTNRRLREHLDAARRVRVGRTS